MQPCQSGTPSRQCRTNGFRLLDQKGHTTPPPPAVRLVRKAVARQDRTRPSTNQCRPGARAAANPNKCPVLWHPSGAGACQCRRSPLEHLLHSLAEPHCCPCRQPSRRHDLSLKPAPAEEHEARPVTGCEATHETEQEEYVEAENLAGRER